MTGCSLDISLKSGTPHLVAECFLNVNIPCSRRNGKLASRWTAVVGVIAEVFFCPWDETLSVELLHLSPAKEFSERQGGLLPRNVFVTRTKRQLSEILIDEKLEVHNIIFELIVLISL